MKKKLIGLAGIIISVIIIYFILQNVSLEKTWEHINKIKLWQLVLLMLLYLSSFVPRAYRWKLMLINYPAIKFTDFLSATIIGFAGNNFIPARGGELLRMEFFSRNTKVPRVTTLTSVLTEKILDGLVLLGILCLGILLSPHSLLESVWLKNLLVITSILFIGALFFISLIKYKANFIDNFLSQRLDKSIFKQIHTLYNKIHDAISFLKLDANTLKIVFSGIIIWLIEALVFIIILYFLGLKLNVYAAGLIVLGVVNFGILVPSSPAYLGVFQGMAILSLSLFNIEESASLTVGVLVHFCQFLPVSLIGLTIFILSFMRKN